MDLDALAESARNRGLKLLRSRVRTPGKGDYGKVGLLNASGQPLFGVEGKSLTATPAEVQAYLRRLEVADWGASLDAPAPRSTIGRKAAANDDLKAPPAPRGAGPASKAQPKPKPPPKPSVRTAKATDASALLPLLSELGYSLDERAFSKRLREMIKRDCAPLVAMLNGKVIGVCGLQVSTMLQRERPVGRITVLVVAEEQRGRGIGRLLLESAEEYFQGAGCELIEVTSNDRHLGAHAFYRRMGFERTSIRFAKSL
jgi:ribosomal protein S18 acetylase RimI-like enzyme